MRRRSTGFSPAVPANGGHAIPPHPGAAYETRQGTTGILPSMAWVASPAQSAAHAQYGRGHSSAVLGPSPHELSSQPVRQQTNLPPAPAMFGPHTHHPHAQPPTRSVLPPLGGSVGGVRVMASGGGGDDEDGKRLVADGDSLYFFPLSSMCIRNGRRERHREGLSLFLFFFPTCDYAYVN